MEKIYIGSYSNSIKICEFENETLKIVNEVKGINNPSYLHVNKNILYTVSETEFGSIASFEIRDNKLVLNNSVELNQSLPCYITTDKNNEHLLVANYGSGSVMMYELQKEGTIGNKEYIKSSDKEANMHFAEFIGNNIYTIDLGNNVVDVLNLKMESISKIQLEHGCGPRHLVTLENQETIYVMTELSNEILCYKRIDNKFEQIQKISTIVTKNIKSYGGAIRISKDNKNIYVTNRGENSISVFTVNNSKLELIQNISSYGDFPRDILFNRNEEYAFVANQKSDNIVIFKKEKTSGKLMKIKDLKIEKPSCIVRSSYGI